jgi:hypothetical protein
MKACTYCGQENEDEALRCAGCGSEFAPAEDPALSDPASALVTLGTFGDLVHATLVKDRLEAAGITACIPEEFSTNPFGSLIGMSHITVQVAARDHDAAKEVLAGLGPSPPPLPGNLPG